LVGELPVALQPMLCDPAFEHSQDGLLRQTWSGQRSGCGRWSRISVASARQSGLSNRRSADLKTFDLDVQRLNSVRHDKGMIEIGVDVLVLPRAQRDEGSNSSSVRLSVEDARTLLLLLKQQFADLDKLQPRSRRSGRC